MAFDPASLAPEEQAALGRFDPTPNWWRRVIVVGVVLSSRWLTTAGNHVDWSGQERFHEARARGRGLLTFSNHTCLFDDPWLTACLTPPRWEDVRWIAADALNFFGTPAKAALFNAGRCVPVVRGAGRDQPGMHFLAERLDAGDWVHIFPEGGRSREVDSVLQTPLKAGLAQMIQATSPLVLPFFHLGMHEVLPIGARVPRLGRRIRVAFGHVTDAAEGLASRPIEEITGWAEDALRTLQAQVAVM